MLKTAFIVLCAVVLCGDCMAGDWKSFNKSVDKIGSSLEVGVTHNRFLELLADANTESVGICESMEQGKKSGSWYCLAFWQFKLLALSWHAKDKPDQDIMSSALASVSQARKKGEKK